MASPDRAEQAPALYAPAYAQLHSRPLEPVLPEPDDAPCWAGACSAAAELWSRVAADDRVSGSFRALAAANAAVVGRARELQKLLPV
jgi:hypothetical protein